MKADWLSFAKSRRRVMGRAEVLDPVVVPLADGLGHVLAEPLVARADLPAFNNSAMDGYAVRAGGVEGASPSAPVRLRVVGRVGAGQHWKRGPLAADEAARIMTGAPVPPGADSVVRVEHTEGGWKNPGTDVVVVSGGDALRNIRPRGEDIRASDIGMESGALVTPGVLALAAALGYETLTVVPRPLVTVLVTGDELCPPHRYDQVIRGRGVPDSNGPMLTAQIRACGARCDRHDTVGDDVDHLREAIIRARTADALVISGGASVGDRDLVKRVLDDLGFELDFWRVRMRPGSPVAFGMLQELPVFSLPGNPASAFVTFEVLVRPFLRARAARRPGTEAIQAVAGEHFAGPEGVTSFLRVKLDRSRKPPVARLSGRQGSGLVRSLGLADGLGIIPEGISQITEGDAVEVTPVV